MRTLMSFFLATLVLSGLTKSTNAMITDESSASNQAVASAHPTTSGAVAKVTTPRINPRFFDGNIKYDTNAKRHTQSSTPEFISYDPNNQNTLVDALNTATYGAGAKTVF